MNGRSMMNAGKRKAMVATAICGAFTLTVAGCGSTSKTAAGSGTSGKKTASGGVVKTYPIGVDIPLSGAAAEYGQLWSKVINLAIKNVNSSDQFKLKADYVDSQALAGPAVTGMEQLVDVDKTPVVLTGFSNVVKSLAPIANRTKTVEINAPASSPALANLGPYVFNDIPLASAQLPAEVNYLVKKLGLKRWSVLYSSEALGEGILASLRTLVPAAGGRIIGTTSVSPTTTSFQAQVDQINAQNPQVVFFADTTGGAVYPAYMNEAVAAGLKAVNATYYGVNTPQSMADKNANGEYTSSNYLNYKLRNPATQELMKSYAAEFGAGATPDGLQLNFYNAVLIVADAISSVIKKHEQVTSQTIRNAIASGTFHVAAETIAFTAQGTVRAPEIQVLEVKNGKQVAVTPPSRVG